MDYLYKLILNAGIPQTAPFLAYDLVERRCKQGEARVDEPAAELWGTTAEELAEIRRSLEELRG